MFVCAKFYPYTLNSLGYPFQSSFIFVQDKGFNKDRIPPLPFLYLPARYEPIQESFRYFKFGHRFPNTTTSTLFI